MKATPSAKRLTFLYFSIVAVSIILIHYTIFELTTDDLEAHYVQNRMDALADFTKLLANNNQLDSSPIQEIQTQGKSDFDQLVKIYLDLSELPPWFPNPEEMEYNVGLDVDNDDIETASFIIKTKLNIEGVDKDVIIAENNSLYELSEEQLEDSFYKQFIISLVLLVFSLWVVMKISVLLTKPISQFAQQLENKNPDDFKPLVLPQAPATLELAQLISTFNGYLQQLETLLERERNFSRYASHELRTPLMIMRGALTLMDESSDPEFLKKQKLRLLDATNNMQEFTETLLNIGRVIKTDESVNRIISKQEIEEIILHHQSILTNKAVTWSIDYREELIVALPEAAFKILLGNVIKNSFSYTVNGRVDIIVEKAKLQVQDTGKGLQSDINKPDGYGLGLLLVKDICKQYAIEFELKPNELEGCTVELNFPQEV